MHSMPVMKWENNNKKSTDNRLIFHSTIRRFQTLVMKQTTYEQFHVLKCQLFFWNTQHIEALAWYTSQSSIVSHLFHKGGFKNFLPFFQLFGYLLFKSLHPAGVLLGHVCCSQSHRQGLFHDHWVILRKPAYKIEW